MSKTRLIKLIEKNNDFQSKTEYFNLLLFRKFIFKNNVKFKVWVAHV